MKKLVIAAVALGFTLGNAARADEGMWLPFLIGRNYEDMKKHGLKLSQEEIYSINKSSLKDAVISFGIPDQTKIELLENEYNEIDNKVDEDYNQQIEKHNLINNNNTKILKHEETLRKITEKLNNEKKDLEKEKENQVIKQKNAEILEDIKNNHDKNIHNRYFFLQPDPIL